MQMPPVLVAFDEGPAIEVKPRSRDLLALERAGLNIEATPPLEMAYRSAFAALERMKRTGEIDIDLPDSAEAFMDLADIEVADIEGEGSGQEATTG